MSIQPDHSRRDAWRRYFWGQPVDPEVLQRPDMRAALAERDIAAVYRILQQCGVSQRRIATLTGQSQSEISEILAGRRVVLVRRARSDRGRALRSLAVLPGSSRCRRTLHRWRHAARFATDLLVCGARGW